MSKLLFQLQKDITSSYNAQYKTNGYPTQSFTRIHPMVSRVKVKMGGDIFYLKKTSAGTCFQELQGVYSSSPFQFIPHDAVKAANDAVKARIETINMKKLFFNGNTLRKYHLVLDPLLMEVSIPRVFVSNGLSGPTQKDVDKSIPLIMSDTHMKRWLTMGNKLLGSPEYQENQGIEYYKTPLEIDFNIPQWKAFFTVSWWRAPLYYPRTIVLFNEIFEETRNPWAAFFAAFQVFPTQGDRNFCSVEANIYNLGPYKNELKPASVLHRNIGWFRALQRMLIISTNPVLYNNQASFLAEKMKHPAYGLQVLNRSACFFFDDSKAYKTNTKDKALCVIRSPFSDFIKAYFTSSVHLSVIKWGLAEKDLFGEDVFSSIPWNNKTTLDSISEAIPPLSILDCLSPKGTVHEPDKAVAAG